MRVRVLPHFSCGHCEFCRTGNDAGCVKLGIIGFSKFGVDDNKLFERYKDGVLAEYVRLPETAVEILPVHVDFELAATQYDLENAHCLLREAHLPLGSTIVITAPTGSLGVSCLKLAQLFRVREVILVGRSKARCSMIEKISSVPCQIVALEDMDEEADLVNQIKSKAPNGVHAIIDLFPEGERASQAIQALKPYGTLVLMAPNSSKISLSVMDIMRNSWRIIGTKLHNQQDADQIRQWIKEGKVDESGLVSHRYKLSDAQEAVAMMLDRQEASHNIVIEMT